MKKLLKILSSVLMYTYNPFCMVLAIYAIAKGYWYLSFPILGIACLFIWLYIKTHQEEIDECTRILNTR